MITQQDRQNSIPFGVFSFDYASMKFYRKSRDVSMVIYFMN